MRPRILAALIGLLPFALGLLPSTAWGQPLPKVRIDQVRIGFRAGGQTCFKSGAWAPVLVDVIAPKGLRPGEAELIVETMDSDGVQNRYVTAMPGLEEDKMTTLMTYVRPGNLDADRTSVSIRHVRDVELDSLKASRMSQNAVGADNILYLVAGARLPSMQRAVLREGQPQVPDEELPYNEGLRHFAFADRVEYLPTRWYGYQAADVLVVTTGNESFIKGLVEEQSQCKEALAEWVRRGGKLVISVGHNHQWASQLLARTKLIDCEIKGSVYRKNLTLAGWLDRQPQRQELPGTGVEVALLAPGKGVDVLVHEAEKGEDGKRDREDRPLMVQAPCGLGRVILIAFDIDQVPFTGWNGQTEFYLRLRRELEPWPSPRRIDPQGARGRGMMWDGQSTELAATLQDGLETFESIPTVSFGWVALFIFLYILVVGPLDYLFLKKVVRRLELTWITFPVVVLVVSTLAYFTAYYLKGNDLKINKMDLVEYDLHRARVYGTTWFTLFSPRIQNYTVGVEPASAPDRGRSGWAPPPADDGGGYSPLVGWMGRPENVYGGSSRSGGQSLFKRAYQYAPNAAALEGVPIQVWATKSFTASWEADFRDQKPPFTSTLHHPVGQPDQVAGNITSHLPIELQDVVMIYRGQVYPVGRLSPGLPWSPGGGARKIDEWLHQPQDQLHDPHHRIERQNRWGGPVVSESSLGQLMKTVLFYRKAAESRSELDNAELRQFDESWRISEKRMNEVIVFGRTAPAPAGSAETVTKDGVSPTRLWLGKVPGPKEQRPDLAGTLLQRTHVRVFIPVETK